MSALSQPRKGVKFHNASSRREADGNSLVPNPNSMGDAITFPDRNSVASSETDIFVDGNHTVAKTIGEVFPKLVLASLSPSGISPWAPRQDHCSNVSTADLLHIFSSAHIPRIACSCTLEASLVYMKKF